MKRREFVKQASIFSASFMIADGLMARNKGAIYGQGNMRYRMNKDWGKLNPEKHPVNDCHEMVQDAKGRILLLTNETKNNVLII